MRPIRARIAHLFVALAFPSLLHAGAKEDFAKLEDAMESAHEEFVAAPQSGGDSKSATGDPRLDILKSMDALAESAGDSPDAADIAVRTFLWSAQLDLDLDRLLARFDRLARHHSNDTAILEALSVIPDVYRMAATPEDWTGALKRVTSMTKEKEVKVAALLATALVQLNVEKLPSAKAALEELIKLDSESDQGKLARGYLFEIEHLQVGMPAPEFTARTVDGKEISLKSLRGKVVLLDFWATWCARCLAETPHLKIAAERFKDKPFAIVGVSLDDFREMVIGTIAQKGLPGTQIWDESGRENPVGLLYNVQELPQWYLIDTEGVILARNCFGDALMPAVENALTTRQ